MTQIRTEPYWLEVPTIKGSTDPVKGGGICVIGSGLAGSSTAYFLEKAGLGPVTLIDYQTDTAASFRNCGHILHGTVESMLALSSLHGEDLAKDIWGLSVEICDEVSKTVKDLSLNCEYKQNGYLVIAIDDAELSEIHQSIELLNKHGFENKFIEQKSLENMGFQNIKGARFEPGSAQAHPVKFRNGVLKAAMDLGTRYFSSAKVLSVDESGGQVYVEIEDQGRISFDAAVVAANAYSPLLSDFYESHKLVEPFKGQIICSKPLKSKLPVSYPHSFDHGYEYALASQDNRLIIGGWRNNTPGGEVGTYDISVNQTVEDGLKDFAKHHYKIDETLEWEYSWAGIMASSKTAFPFIGPTNSPLIYTVGGFTGHGFSWAHGSAKILVDIMAGNPVTPLSQHFNPRLL